jgi:hypothetical protein
MSCASCGKQIPAGSRYCIHCGAEQSPPTPIAAVAAAAMMANASRARAANAAHAEPHAEPRVEPRVEPAQDAANQSSVKDASGDSRYTAMPGGTLAPPAYASAPVRRGLAAGLIGGALLVAVALAVVVGWRMQGSSPEDMTGRDDVDRPAAAQSAAGRASGTPPVAPAAGGATAPAADSTPLAGAREATQRGASSAASPAASPASPSAASGATATREPPIEIKPLPPRPAPAHAARRAPTENRSPPPDAATSAPASPSVPARAESALPPATASAARTPVVSSSVQHWRQMDDELSRCTREDFITRVICGQRVRFRYCDGYWGKVSQCPTSPAPERGQ